MTIKDITSNLSNINITLLIKRALQGVASNNSRYLNLVLQDATGEISARMWDVNNNDIEALKSGVVIAINANSITYNNEIQLKINYYSLDSNHAVNKLLIHAPIDSLTEWKRMITIINNFTDKTLSKVILYLLETNKEAFITRPAAIKIHHSSINGLIWHTSTMLKMAAAVLTVYHDREINPDLVYAGIIMHDFGKLEELSDDLIANFTLQGQLKGHIVLGSEAIAVACRQLKIDFNQHQSLLILQHIILASHGKHEFGSPILPKTIEAEIVHQLDNLDAKITIIDEALKTINHNENTNKLAALENRSFWRHYQQSK